MTNTIFRNANEAYEYLHDKIIQEGIDFGDTKALKPNGNGISLVILT